jgi:YHS domain-containing protein
MVKWLHSLVVSLGIIAGITMSWGGALQAKDAVYTSLLSSKAVSGYDPVAYFRVGKPVEGSGEFTTQWNGAEWRFANAQNLADFKESPEKYAPQYGGYCAWAVSQGYTASSDPEAWKIRDGKLYLNYSKSVQQTWAEDIPGNIAKANANWPKVIE